MRTKILAAFALLPLSVFGQTASSSFSEYFSSATLPASWTCFGSGTSWYSSGQPGIVTANNATGGGCYTPWNTGTGNFDFRFNMDLTQGRMTPGGSGRLDAGQSVLISTGIPGSLATGDISVVIAWSQQGLYAGLRTGEVLAWGTSGGTNAFNADPNDISKLNTASQYLLNPLGPHQLSYTAIINPNFGLRSLYDSIDWPWGSSSGGSFPVGWHWWFHVSRDSSNVLTIEFYNDHYKRGQAPWVAWQYPITNATYQNKQFNYIGVLGYGTSTAQTPAAIISNITGMAGVTGTPFTVANVIPTNAGDAIQPTKPATIIGTGFNCATYPLYNVTIGSGSTLQTTTASCVNSTHLSISSLPSEADVNNTTNVLPYNLHVSVGGVSAELAGGLIYHAATVYRFSPYEIPASPANAADATFDAYGSGFSPSTTCTIAGTSATVTYIDPTHIQIQAPSGTPVTAAAGAGPRIIITTGATTNYDSSTSGTYPFGAKLNFGYAAHPYLWFTPSALTTLRSAYSNASFANWANLRARMLLTPGPFTQDTSNCLDQSSKVCNSPLLGTASRLYEEEYLYHYLETGDTSYLTTWWNELDTHNEFNRIDWTNQQGKGHFNQVAAIQMVMAYDTLFTSLTPARRAQFLDFFDSILEYFNYETTSSDTNFISGGHNRVALNNGVPGLVAEALVGSHNSLSGFTRTAPWAISTNATSQIATAVTREKAYGTIPWNTDGGNSEGFEYTNYGTKHWEIFVDGLRLMNTAMGTNAGNLDQGVISTTNLANFDKFIDQAWIGGMANNNYWSVVNDAEPIIYGEALPWLADQFNKPQVMYAVDQAAASAAALPDYLFYQIGVNLGEFWPFYTRVRSSVSPAFTSWQTSTILSTTQRATLRSGTSFEPDFVMAIKGKIATETNDGSGHTHPDIGSIELGYKGEMFIFDGGYQIKADSNHTVFSVDGNTQPAANAGNVSGRSSTFDAGSNFDTGTYRGVSIDMTNAYPTGTGIVTLPLARRVYVMYSNSAAVMLDDILPNTVCTTAPCGSVTSYYQAAQNVSSFGLNGFTMTSPNSTFNVVFDGPTRTSVTSAPANLGGWVFEYESRIYNLVTAKYVANESTPLVTMFFPASNHSTPLSATVDRSVAGKVTINLSDGGVIPFIQNVSTGKWSVDTANLVNGTGSSAPSPCTVSGSLPNGTVGVTYTTTSVAQSNCSTSAFTVTSGSLPTGLTLNGSTGAVSGTPTTAGTYPFTVAYDTASKAYSLTIAPGCSIGPATLSNGTVGIAYSGSVLASNCTTSSYTISTGSMPPGLTLGSTGAITGTPTTVGTYSFTVAYGTASQAYTVTIAAGCTVGPGALPNGTVGTLYSQPVTASNCSASTYTISSGALPTGLTIDGTSGVISGTPSAAGTYTFAVAYDTDAQSYTVTIQAQASAPDTIAYTVNQTSNNGLSAYTWNSSALGSSNFSNLPYGESLFLNAQFCDPNNAANCVGPQFTISTGCVKTATANSITWTGCSVSGHTFTGTVTYGVSNYTPATGFFAGIAIPTMQETVQITNTDTVSGWNLKVTTMAPSITSATYNSSTTTNGTFFGVTNANPLYSVLNGTWIDYLWIDNISGFADGNTPGGFISPSGSNIKIESTTGTLAVNATGSYRLNERFVPSQSGVSLNYSAAPDAYQTHFNLLGGKAFNWGDRRPILADFFANNSNRSSTNIYAFGTGAGNNTTYDGTPNVSQWTGCNNTGRNITATQYQKDLVAEACKQIQELYTIQHTYGVTFQGVIAWDLEGQEFAQTVSYLGDPQAFIPTATSATAYNPYLSAVQAYFNVFQHASQQPTGWNVPDMKVGMTLRPQHLPYYTTSTLPSTCNFKAEITAIGSNATKTDSTASMTAGDLSNTVTITDSKFVAQIGTKAPNNTPVMMVGSTIIVNGAGPGGTALTSTITQFIDSNHIVIADTASTTVSNALIWYNYFTDYDDRAIVTNGGYGNKFKVCQPTNGTVTYDNINTLFTGTGTWLNFPNGDGVQVQYFKGDTASVINELATKIRTARRLFGATMFYVDSTVWVGGSPMEYTIWKTLNSMFPDVLLVPEEEDGNTWTFATPYTDPKGNSTDPQLSTTTSHRIYAGSGAFIKAQNYIATSDPGWSTLGKRDNFRFGGEIGDIWSTFGWNSDGGTGAGSADNNMGFLYQQSVIDESTIAVTNTANSKVYTFGVDAKSTFDYPLVARVYFATNAASLPSSTLFCEAGRNASQDGIQANAWLGGNACKLDLTGMHAYEIRYQDFAGNMKLKNTNGFTMNF